MIKANIGGIAVVTVNNDNIAVNCTSELVKAAIMRGIEVAKLTMSSSPSIGDPELTFVNEIADTVGLMPVIVLNRTEPDSEAGVVY